MKIGYIGTQSHRVVIEHTTNTHQNIVSGTECVMVEDSRMDTPPDLLALNTCPATRQLEENPVLMREFRDVCGIVEGHAQTYLYGFINEDGGGRVIELTYSTRFLTGDVGPQIGFVQGTAIACEELDAEGKPYLTMELLAGLGYRGEILLGLSHKGELCDMLLGHSSCGFMMYSELVRGGMGGVLEWCVAPKGAVAPKLHYDGIATTTMLSQPPFPHDVTTHSNVRAPAGAEKHLYRVAIGNAEVAYACSWGKDIYEAKRRVRKTIENCVAYSRDVQHRIDYGWKEGFSLCKTQWSAFGGKA